MEKFDRFGNLIGGKRRRIGFELSGDLVDARQHGPPVLHADADVGENLFERVHDVRPARRILHAFDMNVNEALAGAGALVRALKGDEVSGFVALDREHRMNQEADVGAALVELSDNRIDEERHIIVEDFEHRYCRCCAGRREGHLRRAGLALQQKRPRVLGDAGKLRRLVALEVVGHRVPEHLDNEIRRDVAPSLGKQGGGRLYQRLGGGIVLRAGNILDVHISPFWQTARYNAILLARRAYTPLNIYKLTLSSVA